MSTKNLCRLCLTMNGPVRVIADSPLQDIYEKLTEIPLKSLHRPVVACCICYAQLRKCHELMVRSVRADEVLTQILQGNKMGKEELVAMINRCRPGGGLSLTPTELVTIASTEHSLIKMENMEDLPPSQCRSEMETDRELFIKRLKVEESEDEGDIEGVAPEKMDDRESEGLIDQEDVKLEILEEAVDIEEHESGSRARVLEGDVSDAASSNKCNQTQDKNIMRRLRKRGAVLEEDISSRNTGSYKLRSTKKAEENIRQISRNLSVYSVNTRNRANRSVNNDNNSSREHLTEMFICDDCGNVFDDKYLLIEHIEHHDVVNRTSDRTSGEESSHRRTLLRTQRCSTTRVVNKHTDTRRGKKILHCDICKRKFSQNCNLKRHLRTHTGEKPFECEICQNKFHQKYHLKRHLRTHTGEKPFECEICQVKFYRKDHLKTHLRTHTGKRPFECEICQVKFDRKSFLNRHLRTHTGKKPFECEICQVKFNKKYSLKTHLRTHTGEKPFECEICQVKFSFKFNLKTHLRAHTGEKPFECEICQVKFYRKDRLKTHLRTHSGEKPFECEICRVKFYEKSYLKTHLRIHTGEKPFECEICQIKFNHKSSLKIHSRTHTGEKPFECEICQVKFHRKYTLKIHLRTHTGEKPFECEICRVKFYEKSYLKTHLRTHTGEKPFECEICQVKFHQKWHLKAHLRTHAGDKN